MGRFFADKLGKVYTVTHSFRKEQPTKRHLTEYWRMEVVQHCDLENIMTVQEEHRLYLQFSGIRVLRKRSIVLIVPTLIWQKYRSRLNS